MRYAFLHILLLAAFIPISSLDSCMLSPTEKPETYISKGKESLDRIKKAGILRVTTDYNSTTYFIYKGHPMGFHYELLQYFADHLGVKLEIKTITDKRQIYASLLSNESDLVALDMAVTEERKDYFAFTDPIIITRQVLVQRNTPKDMYFIKTIHDLEGKEVYVPSNSSYVNRLKQLEEEMNIDINIVENPEYQDEELIRMVAEGKIMYTVADEHIALINKTYFPNINISLGICIRQNLAWSLNKNATALQEELNIWLREFKKKDLFQHLYKKYFKNPRYTHLMDHDYFTLRSGKLSPFDPIIKKHAKTIGWDWRLLAALIFQESQFNTNLTSWAGAYGIMQMMPETAANYGIDSTSSVDDQIRAGVLFIKYLDKIFSSIEDKDERTKFILASYNSGPGHVLDAMRLAEKYGKNPHVWTAQTDSFMLFKSNPKYYHLAEVKNGYSRGYESFKFVSETLERYQHFKNAAR